MTTESKELLGNFFGAYFHEDWQCDDRTTGDVAKRYAKEVGVETTSLLITALKDFVKEYEAKSDIEEILFTDFGCYYMPSASGLSTKQWIEELIDQLRRASDI